MANGNTLSDMTRTTLEALALDFVVNDMQAPEIQSKYNLSQKMYYEIVNKMNLHAKRESYRKKVLDKALERCSNYQSKIIYKATEILHGHVEQIHQKMRKQEKVELSSSEIRDVMAILQIITKEYRLDHGKPTENAVHQVEVKFPEGFSPITKKPDIIIQPSSQKEVEAQEETEEKIKVEIDNDIIESPL